MGGASDSTFFTVFAITETKGIYGQPFQLSLSTALPLRRRKRVCDALDRWCGGSSSARLPGQNDDNAVRPGLNSFLEGAGESLYTLEGFEPDSSAQHFCYFTTPPTCFVDKDTSKSRSSRPPATAAATSTIPAAEAFGPRTSNVEGNLTGATLCEDSTSPKHVR